MVALLANKLPCFACFAWLLCCFAGRPNPSENIKSSQGLGHIFHLKVPVVPVVISNITSRIRMALIEPLEVHSVSHFSMEVTSNIEGKLLGIVKPAWIGVCKSEQRLSWLKSMCERGLAVREIELYAKTQT